MKNSEIGQYIPQIAKATREIELLPLQKTPSFNESSRLKNSKKLTAYEGLLASSKEWASQVPMELGGLLNILEASKKYEKYCPSHGDFVVRQMYPVDQKIGIIDGEHASANNVYHYDVAQCYLRLRVDHSKVLADQYLQHFYNLLPEPEKKNFWQLLRAPLAQRYIGDLWGAKNNKDKLESLELIGRDILQDKIAEML